MDYENALSYIHGAHKFGTVLGLGRIRKLLDRLGNPQNGLKFIHIAGTNGKGSVAAIISEILISNGFKVGLFTSPFIEDFRERITINREFIEKDALVHFTKQVKNASGDDLKPTVFEIITAIALCHFSSRKCDFCVLETGLGGRLDATNVIESPLGSVITSISFDHMEHLGNSISKIAHEKCGIIKGNSKVIAYPVQEDEAWEVIKKTCRIKKSELIIPSMPLIRSSDLYGTDFIYENTEFTLSLLGEHQVYNAVTAIETVHRCCGISYRDMVGGVKNTHWKGRFEIISREPLFIIDGAHNLGGIESLKNTIIKILSGKRLIFIMGMLKDKEHEKSLMAIAPLSSELICVDVPNPRTLPARNLAAEAQNYAKSVRTADSCDEAVRTALSLCDKNSAICAFGSLYLLGDIRKSLKKYI